MSLPTEDRVRMRHMRDMAGRAVEVLGDRDAESLMDDDVTTLALLKMIEIVGEAAGRVSEATRAAIPEIPWRVAADTRNRLSHGYHDVDLDTVWVTITRDFPRLLEQLNRALEPDVQAGTIRR